VAASARTTLVDDLKRALAEGPPLRLAILFGSAVSGRARPDSDVDVGILPDDTDLPLHAELDLQSALERACGRPVDLVRLDRASTLLKWEAARHGVPILTRSHADHVGFVVGAALEYADLWPALSRAATVFRERLVAPPREAQSK
jgi:predicted nucleotidyltransferase